MIKEIQLQNFKCFQRSKVFEFGKLNLLTGINGRGKSSLLQSILVLSQSAWHNADMKKLVINDDMLQLGNFDDIKNSETPRGEKIHFNFKFDTPFLQEVSILYQENPDQPLLAELCNYSMHTIGNEKATESETKHIDEGIELFAEIIKKVHFVSADRLGPVKYVDKINLPEFIHVGPRGEQSINILANSLNLPVVNKLLYRGSDANSVLQQTIEWMSYILEGAKIDIGGKEKESSVLYMLLNNRSNSYGYKPANVGFGYSYVLPLIVTGLIAKPGELIIVENPEAHLHPRAQAKIAEFFSIVASCDVQVFVESHSEHILNGFRISALRNDIDIDYSEVALHYFNESFDSERLLLESTGRIANWPQGFFDQQEIDLDNIFKFSR